MIPNLPERLAKELQALTNFKVQVLALKNRENSSWMGGSIMSSMHKFQSGWLTKEEYDEEGARCVDQCIF